MEKSLFRKSTLLASNSLGRIYNLSAFRILVAALPADSCTAVKILVGPKYTLCCRQICFLDSIFCPDFIAIDEIQDFQRYTYRKVAHQ